MSKMIFWLIPLWMGISLFSLEAAYRKTGYYDNEQAIAINENRDGIDRLRHQVDNQEVEIRSFQEQMENLNAIIENLRDQLSDQVANQKEILKGNTQNLEMKMGSLENMAKGLSADIKQLQNHANETSNSLNVMKQKLAEWEGRLKTQNQNIENLQSALQSMLELVQAKADFTPTPSSGYSGRTYVVKSGDSLGSIAKSQQTTVQAIKELNGMTTDKIVVGKTLKIPN